MKIKSFLIASLFVACSVLPLWAAPSKPSVSGTVADGQVVTITGTGFGSTGPTIVLFDDFEKGSNGAGISTVSNSATVNNWTGSAGQGIPTYSSTQKHSGALALRSDVATGESSQIARVNISSATKIYQSFWLYIPSSDSWPSPNWKTSWFAGSGAWPDTDYTAAVIFSDGSVPFSFGCDDPGTGNRYGYITGGEWAVGSDIAKGRWVRQSMYAVLSPSAGIAQYWETGPSGTRTILNDSSLYTANAGRSAAWWNLPGYGGNGTAKLYYDDAYLAIGDGARARIEIGNSATYTSCTNLAVGTVTSWSDSSVSVTIRGGSFSSGNTVYLYVVDSSGAVSPASDPITIGAGGDTTAPTVTAGSDVTVKNTTTTTLTGSATDDTGVTSCKWRFGSAPDANNGTACTVTTSWSCDVTGLTLPGANTVYVGCGDAAGNWGSDSVVVNLVVLTNSGCSFSGAALGGN